MFDKLNLDKISKDLERKRTRLNVLYKVYKVVVMPIFQIAKASSVIILFIIAIFPPLLIYLIISGSICILTGLIPSPKHIYRNSVKEKVLQSVFKSINPSLSYSLYESKRQRIYSSNIFKKQFVDDTKYIIGHNYVSGNINDFTIEFSEIKFYKDVINYAKTIGGCLMSILLLPIFIIRGMLTKTNDDDDLPVIGIIKDEIKFYEGLFMHVGFKTETSGNLLLIPNELLSDNDKFSTHNFGNVANSIKSDSIGLPLDYKLYYTEDINENMLKAVVSTFKEVYLKNGNKTIVSLTDSNLYVTIPRRSDYLDFVINKKVNTSDMFEPYLKEFELFQNAVKTLQTKFLAEVKTKK